MSEVTIETLQAELESMKAAGQKSLDALTAQNELLGADNDKWKAKHAEAEKHRKKQEADARKANEEAARKSGDSEAIDKSWSEKYGALEAAKKEADSSYKKIINSQVVDAAAHQLASSIAMDGYDEVLLPHITSRLYSEISDGQVSLKVKGLDGKPSALTIDELKVEFTENKAFERIIKGSSASGGGKPGAGGNGGAKTVTRDMFDAMGAMNQGRYIREGGKVHD